MLSLPMSRTSSSIVILLLFVATYSCNGRPIGVRTIKEADTAKSSQSHSSSQNHDQEKSTLSRVSLSSNERPSRENRLEIPKEDLVSAHVVDEKDQRRKAEKLGEKDHDDHGVETESLHDTVTWKLPHQKRSEPQPGFNLDYAPPKTHPPVHN